MPTVLIIEDEDLLRKLLSRMLISMGFAVSEASDGVEGLALFEHSPVDLVLTDLIMPRKNGLDTIVELMQRQPDLKIIAMSGGARGASYDILELAERLGASYALSKPFSKKQLTDAIDLVLCRTKTG